MIVRQAFALVALLAIVPTSATYAQTGADTRGPDSYVVQPGDSLTSISSRTGVSVDAIVRLNRLSDADTIFVGSTLRLRDSAMMGQQTASNTTARMAQPLQVSPPSVVAASLPSQAAQVQAQMQAAGPAPSYALPIPLAVGNPSNIGAAQARGPMGHSLQGTVANASIANAAPRLPDSPSLLPGAPVPLSVQIALQHMGAPYEYGGAAPGGFDCSGFVHYVLGRAGRTIPRDLAGQYSAGVRPQGSLEPGDLVFFENTYDWGLSHVGIYLGNGQFIHALDEARGVVISSLNESFYANHWYGATRLP